jgi:SsrA-binding protein
MKKQKMLARNKSARHDYYIEDTYEAGLVLTGTEIKSLRAGKVSINESYVKISGSEAEILGMNISPYAFGNIHNVDPMRARKLLLHKKEITKLAAKIQQEGLTVVPLSVYINEDGRAKMEIAVARGKKLYDKRESIAERDAQRRMDRAVRK